MDDLIVIDVSHLGYSEGGLDRLAQALAESDWDEVVVALVGLLGEVEAVLLYGSRSRGSEHSGSDYDLLVVKDGGPRCEGLRWTYAGLDLDIEVVDATLWTEPLEGRLYLGSGRLLHDASGRMREWLQRLESCRQAGPTGWSVARRLRMASWLQRMLNRSHMDGTLGALRRAALAAQLPEVAVESQGQWPGSPLQNLHWLQQHWPELATCLDGWAAATDQQGQLAPLEEAVKRCRERLLRQVPGDL